MKNLFSFSSAFEAKESWPGLSEFNLGKIKEKIKKTNFYSLGNFVFDQDFSEKTMIGLAIEAKIKNKEIVGIHSSNVKISPTFQPEFLDL